MLKHMMPPCNDDAREPVLFRLLPPLGILLYWGVPELGVVDSLIGIWKITYGSELESMGTISRESERVLSENSLWNSQPKVTTNSGGPKPNIRVRVNPPDVPAAAMMSIIF